MKNYLLIQPVMRPLMSPKRMAPFGSNMHYKTNFRIGIPGMPFDHKLESFQSYLPQSETGKIYKLSDKSEFPSPPSNVQLQQNIMTSQKQILQNNLEPYNEGRKLNHQIINEIKHTEDKEILTDTYKPVEISEKSYEPIQYKNERNSVYSKESLHEPKHDKGDFNSIVSPRKDAIGLFLPSQYEDPILKNKDKNQKFQRELAILQSRRLQQRQVII